MRQDRTTWARIGRTQGLSVRAGCCRCLAAGAELTRNLRGARRFAADSEKDPGYPFLAAPFQAAGIIRLAPLFYGALGCLGLFFGARRWLGRYGGAAAVVLFCSSGAALLFAWRDYMPTFTEASLIAAGTGALLWAVLAGQATARRRTWAGLAGFATLEAAVFVRYTGIVVLGCAVAAVAAAAKLRAVPGSALRWWLGSVAVSGAGVALSDDLVHGGPLTSGYRPGEITFSLAAVPTSLRYMPARLIAAMPMLVPGLAALAWIAGQRVRLRRAGQERAAPAVTWPWGWPWPRPGSACGGCTPPAPGQPAPSARPLQFTRFYVPTAAVSLPGSSLVTRLPRRASLAAVTSAAAAAMSGLGLSAGHVLGPAVGNDILCALTWCAALTMGYAANCRFACIFR